MQSCNGECEEIICQNGSICNDGTCECPGGYYGSLCENETVQHQLDVGITPIDLVNEGVPLDSLYGKMYVGGIIFYQNTDNGRGLVAATEDQSSGAEWGCI